MQETIEVQTLVKIKVSTFEGQLHSIYTELPCFGDKKAPFSAKMTHLASITVFELPCSQDEVDVINHFAVQHHRTVLLVRLKKKRLTW